MGSPLYMSPEQMRSSKDVDARRTSGRWASSCLSCSSKAAVPSAARASVEAWAIISWPRSLSPPIRQLRPDVAAGARAGHRPRRPREVGDRRFQTIADFAIALGEYGSPPARMSVDRIVGTLRQAGFSDQPPPPMASSASGPAALGPSTSTAWGQTQRSGGRRAAFVGAGVGVVLVLAAGGLVASRVLSPRVRIAPADTVAPVEPAAPQASSIVPLSPLVMASDADTASAAPAVSLAASSGPLPAGPALVPTSPRPASPGQPQAHKGGAAPTASGSPAPNAACSPPYYFDADGHKQYKPECMRRTAMNRLLLPLGLLFILAFTLPAASARADDKAACLDAASKGQSLRDQGKLVEAREQFRRCAAQGCPQMVVQDCGGWLSDVEKNLPTVVVTAKDGAGNDSVDVKVTLDGQPLLAKLTGEALPVNPGPHAFHFEGAGGLTVDRQVLVKQGDKNQEVAAVLGAPAAATPAAPQPPAAPAPAAAPPASVHVEPLENDRMGARGPRRRRPRRGHRVRHRVDERQERSALRREQLLRFRGRSAAVAAPPPWPTSGSWPAVPCSPPAWSSCCWRRRQPRHRLAARDSHGRRSKRGGVARRDVPVTRARAGRLRSSSRWRGWPASSAARSCWATAT